MFFFVCILFGLLVSNLYYFLVDNCIELKLCSLSVNEGFIVVCKEVVKYGILMLCFLKSILCNGIDICEIVKKV